ncbi:MAG TPA: AbrB/MazE/SpoVT family DNA-binding domain-containing protein [Candidatus Thermoplasmatota archaeon]|nr:AbrB/MazE/SpoVT family DNA-binding domain-containing protein [Candidatus Thermoplasmatota archaeon]
MSAKIRRRLTEWGNGYGIRLTKAEAKKLGLRAGDTVDVELRGSPAPNDVARLPALHLGGTYDIDEIVEEEADAGR